MYLVLPYLAIGLITFVVFSHWDEKYMEPEDREPAFARLAGLAWPIAWVMWLWATFYVMRNFKD